MKINAYERFLTFIIKQSFIKDYEGIKRIELEYVDGNKRAKRLYESMKFKKEGARLKAFRQGRKYVSSIIMGRWLG